MKAAVSESGMRQEGDSDQGFDSAQEGEEGGGEGEDEDEFRFDYYHIWTSKPR